ncbi:MAG: hypothetical protein AMXMBFR7_50790 [Planctomycetota bacterium]
MSLPTDVRIAEARVAFEERRLRTPLILSTGPIAAVTQATVAVRVENARGQSAAGTGTIYLSDLWSWPDPKRTHAERDAAMQALCVTLAQRLPEIGREPAHALDHGVALEHALHGLVRNVPDAAAPMPFLAALVCASPFDAAVHDAFGKLLGRSAYAALAPEFLPRGLEHYLGAAEPLAQGRHLSEFVRRRPHARLNAWHIVGKADALTHAEFARSGKAPLGDGLPDCVEGWIERLGLACFKLKITGTDNVFDVKRTVDTFAAVREVHDRQRTGRNVMLSIDSNEANPDVASVVDYLERLHEASPRAYDALGYVEQPTGRDLKKANADVRPIALRKPVFVDEALTGLELLPTVRAQGWSGLALKTCKGQTGALLCAAWCHLHGMPYTLQDLTNPGAAWIQGIGLAAHLETLNGVELNAYQYTPAAIGAEPVFRIEQGWHETAELQGVGLA